MSQQSSAASSSPVRDLGHVIQQLERPSKRPKTQFKVIEPEDQSEDELSEDELNLRELKS